jgi:hypothetical protein
MLLGALYELWTMLQCALEQGANSLAPMVLSVGLPTLQQVQQCLQVLLPEESSSSSSSGVSGSLASSSRRSSSSSMFEGILSSAGCSYSSKRMIYTLPDIGDERLRCISGDSAMRLQLRLVAALHSALSYVWKTSQQQSITRELVAQSIACERSTLLPVVAGQQLTAVCKLLHQQLELLQQAAVHDDATTGSSSSSRSNGTGSIATMQQQAASSISRYHEELLPMLQGGAQPYVNALASIASSTQLQSDATAAAGGGAAAASTAGAVDTAASLSSLMTLLSIAN